MTEILTNIFNEKQSQYAVGIVVKWSEILAGLLLDACPMRHKDWKTRNMYGYACATHHEDESLIVAYVSLSNTWWVNNQKYKLRAILTVKLEHQRNNKTPALPPLGARWHQLIRTANMYTDSFLQAVQLLLDYENWQIGRSSLSI